MLNIVEGNSRSQEDSKLAIVASKFNEFVTNKLLEGCLKTLKESNVLGENIVVVKVPGAFEIPTIVKNLLDQKTYASIICLGAVIRGETPHFDYICSSVSNQISYLGAVSGVPIIFGIITTNSLDQALNRAGGKVGNKGSEAALTALEMVSVVSKIKLLNNKTSIRH